MYFQRGLLITNTIDKPNLVYISCIFTWNKSAARKLARQFPDEGIDPSDLNDDVVGRTLDAIYKYGATELFNQIALHVMGQFSLGTQLIHVDTTNFSVSGKYENDAPDATDSIRIAFGHAKDGRMDLKRFVLGLVTNQVFACFRFR